MTVSRRLLGPALAGALLWSTGCDTSGTITFAPELEVSFGFEQGLSPWEARSSGAGEGSGVAAVTTPVSEGQGALRLTLAGDGGAVVWIQREFDLTPNVAYDVTLAFDLASSDQGSDAAWTVLAGAMSTEPFAASLPVAGSTGQGAGGQPLWETRTRITRVAADAMGRLWVVLGIEATSAGTRNYGLDEVTLRFQRVED